jgi:hypothetical protein
VILVRAWIGQALGACGAAVLVPAAMVGVLVALTLSGGLGRIGNIGQVFSGPRLPAAVAPSPSSAAKVAPRSGQLAAVLGSGAPRSAGIGPAGAPGRPGSGGRPAAHPGPSGGSGGQGGSGGPGRGSGGSGGPAAGSPSGGSSGSPSTGPAGPSPTHRPSPGPSLVSRVTGAAASAAGQLPGPLGPAAAQAVETVGSAAGAPVPPVPVQALSHADARLPAQSGTLASIK